MPWVNFTISETKVSLRNKEAVIFSYILPSVLLMVLVLIFKKSVMSVLPGISISAVLITAFFGTTDWIVILRTTGFFRCIRRFRFPKLDLWIGFFISRLIIVLFQILLITFISIILNKFSFEKGFIEVMIFGMLFAIPMILIGIVFSSFAGGKSVRPICGMSVLLGLFLFGVFNSLLPEFITSVSNSTVIGKFFDSLFNGPGALSMTPSRAIILSLWLLIPGILNYKLFPKSFNM